eukprot:238735-Chlamydomonas_euryale.AAC.2
MNRGATGTRSLHKDRRLFASLPCMCWVMAWCDVCSAMCGPCVVACGVDDDVAAHSATPDEKRSASGAHGGDTGGSGLTVAFPGGGIIYQCDVLQACSARLARQSQHGPSL